MASILHDLVFCREDGTPLDRWQVQREFGMITKAAGPPPISPTVTSKPWRWVARALA